MGETLVKSTKILKRSGLLLGVVLLSGVLITPTAFADNTVLYFVRHMEKQNQLDKVSPEGKVISTYKDYCVEYKNKTKTCCVEELSDRGYLHRNELADWFAIKQITPKLDHVFSSHKQRTEQTVEEIAADAQLIVQPLGPICDNECASGCESGKDSIFDTVETIEALPPGSTALIGQHSGTIYLIMEDLGIDTSDENDFPRDGNGKVDGYNNLWKVTFTPTEEIKVDHMVLDLTLERTN